MRETNAPAVRRSSNLPQDGHSHPFMAFREEMDRLFDTFFSPTRFAAPDFGRSDIRPALDLSENENEIRLRAELPGVDEKDVEISLDRDVLTIRGEKREERRDDTEQRRVIERSYGSFERSIALPFEPKEDEVKAEFRNGVLTVTAKKPPELAHTSKRIPIAKV